VTSSARPRSPIGLAIRAAPVDQRRNRQIPSHAIGKYKIQTLDLQGSRMLIYPGYAEGTLKGSELVLVAFVSHRISATLSELAEILTKSCDRLRHERGRYEAALFL
jgi:hypothetical protein